MIARSDKLPLLVTAGNDARLVACCTREGPQVSLAVCALNLAVSFAKHCLLTENSWVQAKRFRLTPVPEAPEIRFASQQEDGRIRLLAVHKENADVWHLTTAAPPLVIWLNLMIAFLSARTAMTSIGVNDG